jgi:hypothetical protein
LQALQIEPTSAEAMRIDSSGNVGIGTGASVSQRLHVLDTDVTPLLLQRDGATSDAFGSGLLFGNDFSNNGVFIFGAPSSGIRFGYTTDITSTNPVTTGTEVMRIDASGNVGIGTDSPDSKLVVSNGAAASGVEFIPATGSASLVSIERASNAFEPFRYRALDHRFETGASQSEAMRIDANGRVGVGTNNPGIANSFTDDHVVNNTGGAGAGYTAICADDDYSGYRLGNVSNTSLGIVDGNFDSSGDGTMRVLSKDVLVLGTGNFVERMRINSSGNVGVGTSSPTGVTSGITTLAISDAGSKTTGDKNGALAFITNDGSYTGTYADGVTAEIASVADSATGAAYGLSFLTSTITSSNRAERMRIDSSGTVQFQNAIREKQYNLVGTAIVPTNGTIQYKTLSANTTFTESLSDGEYVTLMIDDGAGYTITWPTTTWVGGSAPTLETAGYNVIELWQVNSVLYGAFVGAA